MDSLIAMSRQVREWAQAKGWRGSADNRTFGDEIALITSELSEALEAFRISHDPKATWIVYNLEVEGIKFKKLNFDQYQLLTGLISDSGYVPITVTQQVEGVPTELADTMIRLLDVATQYGIDLGEEFIKKMAFNEGREFRHGGRAL